MKWTQRELEELYQRANAKGLADPEFRKRLGSDPRGALEELCGEPLPEGLDLELVDGDSRYASAYFTPDFTGGELSLGDLRAVAGGAGEEDFGGGAEPSYGINVVLIVSVCPTATMPDSCITNVCNAAMCDIDFSCPAKSCPTAICTGLA